VSSTTIEIGIDSRISSIGNAARVRSSYSLRSTSVVSVSSSGTTGRGGVVVVEGILDFVDD
jgi:hypothetical protein